MMPKLLCLIALLFVLVIGTVSSEELADDVPPELSNWLLQNARSFATDDPMVGLDDLASLSEIVGDAQIVALGEATHGTAEFFRMKHRIFRYLVEVEGFRVFMIEANMPEALAVNQYVRTGEGNAKTVLAGLHFWVWRTQEVLDLIEWMRDWNIEHPNDPVYFHGFDVQFWRDGSDRFLRYIETVDPDYAQEIEDDIFCLEGREFPRLTTIDDCSGALLAIRDHYKAMQADYVRASNRMDYLLHRQVLETVTDFDLLDQANRDGDDDEYFNRRDRSMANHVIAFAEDIFPNDRILLWAHNAHLQSTGVALYDEQNLLVTMGVHLRDHFEDDYVNFGFVFNSGSFNAIEMFSSGSYGRLRVMEVLPLLPNSHEFVLSSIDETRYFLDTRVEPSSPAFDWLNQDKYLRTIGAVYTVDATEEQFAFLNRLQESFNVLIYFEQTSPSILLFPLE